MKLPLLTSKAKQPVIPKSKEQLAAEELARAKAKAEIYKNIIPVSTKPKYENVEAALQAGMKPVDIISPDYIELDFDDIKIGEVYFRTLYISGYPRFVNPGWLDPIINFDHSLDISFFMYPVEGQEILTELRRKITEMEAEISTDIQKGKIADPGTEAKLDDAKLLQTMLVKGSERFFEFAFYMTIPAPSIEELNAVTKRVESTLGSLLISGKHAALDMNNAFISTTPLGKDLLLVNRNMDTTSLATTFPFTTAELSGDTGILYGINSQNDSFVIFDRFELENTNMTVFATSGAGKTTSYRTKVLYRDSEGTKLGEIGNIVEDVFKENSNKVVSLDSESEGVIDPNLRVFTFGDNLKGEWSDVEIAARKLPPENLFDIKTRSGREITTTGDHNFVVLNKGKILVKKGKQIKSGDYVPVPRIIDNPQVDVHSKYATKEFLTLLGLITSEGYTGLNRVSIYNTDSKVLSVIKESIENSGYKATLIKKSKSPLENIKVARGYDILPGPKINKVIWKLGAGGLSGDKRVPGFIFGLSKKQIAIYLKAYFEGDGGVENHEITATTKSKDLASDLQYLLLYFGIIARVNKKIKYASNTKSKTKRSYYKLSISGQENLARFIKEIGFITKRKNDLAKRLLKLGNTNIDVIPEIGIILKQIYPKLYNSEIPAPKKFSEIKLGIFDPSPKQLKKIIRQIEARISEIESLETDGLSSLGYLPTTMEIVDKAKNKKVNKKLWEKLKGNWPSIRDGRRSYLGNVLPAVAVTHNLEYSHEYISGAVYRSFRNTGESLQMYDKSLYESVVLGNKNPEYNRVIKARDFIYSRYQTKKRELKSVKQKIAWLKTLANADLFWDEIVSVKKVKSKHKYVYDLQVKNQVFLAGQGGMFVHNSFFVKLEAVRMLMTGTQIIVIDPENEYKAIAEAVDGEYINFSANNPAKINPFDLAQVYEKGEDQLGLKILTLHSLFKVIMGDLSATQEALLDRSLIDAYRAKGITRDPDTQDREPPLMEDLYKALIGNETDEALDLAARLEKFVRGSYQGVFDQQTNIDIQNPFTVFSVRDVEDAIRPIVMFVILDYIWTKVRRDVRKRILIVDEAWHMMKHQDSAQFMWMIAKRARKYYLGLTTITQDVEDFLSHDIGKAVVTNAAMRLLLKQSPAAIDKITEVFYLSQGERQLLLAADVGEGILFAGPHHAPIRVVASPDEYKFVTTKPSETIEIRAQQAQSTPSEVAQVTSIMNQK